MEEMSTASIRQVVATSAWVYKLGMGLWYKIFSSDDLPFRLFYLIGRRPKIVIHWAIKDCVRGPFPTCKLGVRTVCNKCAIFSVKIKVFLV